MMRRPLAIGLAVILISPEAGSQTIDDFDGSHGLDAWSFSNGAEFPGADGALTTGVGREGDGAELSYDFSAGGRYVAMTRELEGVRAGDTLVFWLRGDPMTSLTLRITDSTGQTVQLTPEPAFESITHDGWYPMLFSPSTPRRDFWGGAEDGVLRNELTSFGILVANDDFVPQVGKLGIDDLVRVSAEEVTLDPAAPGRSLSTSTGDLFERWGVAVHRMGDGEALDALRDLGVRWVRTDMWWNSVETAPGIYHFEQWDRELEALESRGMGAVLLLNYGNDLYGGGPPTTQEALDAYGGYAEAAAEHFRGRDIVFELWNEPDGPNFWPPGNRPLEYSALLDVGVARIRAADPAARISSGGVSWFFWDYFKAVLDTGAAEGVDYFGVHAYGSTPPERAVGNVVRLRQLLERYFEEPPPVINTEWGFSSFGLGSDGHTAEARERQAVLAVRSQLASWTAGLPISIWYDVADDCSDADDNECNFGLLDQSGEDKPALLAFRQLASVAAGRRLAALLSEPGGPHCLRVEGTEDAVLVVWLSETDSEATIVAPEPLDAWDLYGEDLGVPSGELRLRLRESDGPIYLRYPWPGEGGAMQNANWGGEAGAGGAAGQAEGASTRDTDDDSKCGCRIVQGSHQAPWALMLIAGFGLRRAVGGRRRLRNDFSVRAKATPTASTSR